MMSEESRSAPESPASPGSDATAAPFEPPADALDNLNWGALGLTPFWLLRNGFFLTLVIFCVLALFSPLLTLPISFVFWLRGTRWSWGNGQRWPNYDSFAESQAGFNLVGIAATVAALTFLTLQLVDTV